MPAARQRAAGRAFQLLGDLLVGRGRRLGAVPGAPVGVELGLRGLGQGGVQRVPFLRRRRAVGRRAHGTGDGTAPARRSRAGRRRPPPPRPADRCRAARPRATRATARRRDRPPRAAAAAACPREARSSRRSERVLDAHARRPGRPKPPASSAALMPRGSSSSASGLPRVSAMIRSRTCSSSRPGDDRRQQGARVLVTEPLQAQLRQARQLALARSARGRRTRPRAARRAAGAPRTRAPAPEALVEPLEIVHETQQRLRPRPPPPAE